MYQLLPDGIVRHPDGLTTFDPDADAEIAERYRAWLAAGHEPLPPEVDD